MLLILVLDRLKYLLTAVVSLVLLSVSTVSLKAEPADSIRRLLPQLKGEERVKAYLHLYLLSEESGDLDEQLRCVNDWYEEARRQHRPDDEVDALATKAALFYNNDLNDSVFQVIPEDMKIVKGYKQWNAYYEMWAHIANTYVFTGQNNLGVHETQTMYEDAKKQGSDYGMGLAYCIMGTAYANLRSFDQSIDAFQKSLGLLSAIKPSPSILPDTYTYYGNALNDMKAYDRLESLTRQWHAFLTQYIKDHKLEGSATADLYLSYYYLACSQASLGLGKLDEAERMLLAARDHIYAEEGYRGGKWIYYMAQLCLQRGDYMGALNFNNRRLGQLSLSSDKTVVVMVNEQRAEIMQRLGRYEEAARLYREVYLTNDSVNKQETKSQLNEMNTVFQVSELEMQQERAQFRFIIIVVAIIILSLAVFIFFRIRAAHRLQQAHSELQTAYKDLQAANEVIEETTAAKERIESELRIARDIQMGMVPATFPDRKDMDLFASMTPAKEVGGDLYDYLLIEPDGQEGTEGQGARLYFCLGDVSGKGVPASLFMSQATRLFRALAKQELMPADIATRLNAELSENNDNGMFVTMFIGLVDLTTGHLHFCNAGHNPPVLKGDTECRFLEMEPNAPIGLWPGLDYEGEEIESIVNEFLFVYTDGLNEAENNEQAQFGDDRLLELLKNTPFESARQTVEMLKAEVEKHREGAEPNDDLTMLCLRVES